MVVSLGRLRFALGDGATDAQARRVYELLRKSGFLGDIPEVPPLMGVAEIAARVGLTHSAVSQWKDMPKPVAHLKQGRVWAEADIVTYLERKTKR